MTTNTNDALAEYANPLNWDADANGVRRIWREPGSDTPDAYNGFEMARAALTTAAVVVPPSSATLERLREWEAKGELLERAWDTMAEQAREIIRLESLLAAAPKAAPAPAAVPRPSDEEIDAHVGLFRWDTTAGRRDLVRAALARWRGAPAAQGEALDAARYRYLTLEMGSYCITDADENSGGVLKAGAADAAIDAARSQAKEGGAT